MRNLSFEQNARASGNAYLRGYRSEIERIDMYKRECEEYNSQEFQKAKKALIELARA
jgi:hypothetical protein